MDEQKKKKENHHEVPEGYVDSKLLQQNYSKILITGSQFCKKYILMLI